MKNKLYNLLMLVAVLFMTACSADEGTSIGGDSMPSIIAYTYNPGEGYNADNDVRVRFVTNNCTESAYYLTELTSAKEAYIAEHGEAAYADKVIKEGTKLQSIQGESTQDVIITGIFGENTITAVAVSGNEKHSSSVSFFGIKWNSIGQCVWISSFFAQEGQPAQIPVMVDKADHAEWYRVNDLYEEGLPMIIKGDGSTFTVDKQNVFTDGQYGASYAEGSGQMIENGILFVLKFTCAAGSFGEAQEKLVLPSSQK